MITLNQSQSISTILNSLKDFSKKEEEIKYRLFKNSNSQLLFIPTDKQLEQHNWSIEEDGQFEKISQSETKSRIDKYTYILVKNVH